MNAPEAVAYRFGTFVLVPAERMLLDDREPVPLPGKAFDLLVTLVSQAGHLVTKDELLERVWPGVVVEEVNLSVNISAIRKALARSAQGREWIETLPRQGYRFDAEVVVEHLSAVAPGRLRTPAIASASSQLPGAAKERMVCRSPAILLAPLALAVGLVALSGLVGGDRAQAYPAVAVLPFEVDQPSNAHLADGLAEETINALTRVTALRVVPRASAFRFRGSDAVSAGQRLGVSVVVTGSLAREGERVDVHVELIDVARAAQVWGARYRVDAAELPRLQQRLIGEVGRSLRLRGPGGEGQLRVRDPTTSAAAYQAYQQGRFLWNQRSEPELRRALDHFRRAIELDAGFAQAHAALADTYATLGYLSLEPPAATFPLARLSALKALELDPSLSQAHASLAYVRFYFDWDWVGAAASFQRAIELNPNDPVSRQWHAVYLLAVGDPDSAMREIETARRLDPLSLPINTDLGFHHYYNRRYREAITQLDAVLGMKADFPLAQLWLARSYLEEGSLEQSLAATTRAEAGSPEWPVLVAARGYTLGVMGRTADARSALVEMQRLSKQRFVTPYGVALVHAGLGDKEQAYRWLDQAFAERSHWLVWLRLDPRWKILRNEPRFAELVQRMNFPE